MPGSRTMFPAHWRDPRRRGMAEHLRVRNRETEPTLEPMPEATRFQSFSRSHNSYTGVAMRPVRPRRLAWTDYRPAEVLAFIDARTVESLRPGFESQRGRPPGTRQVPARSHQSERPEFFWQISVRHVVEAVLRERLLLRLLVDLQHRLDFVPPEFVVEPGVRHLGVERTDVSRRERVRREVIIQDVACGDPDEFRGGGCQILGDVRGLDRPVGHGSMDSERPGVAVCERCHIYLQFLIESL